MLSASAFAWDDCPYGLVNDSYPGQCVRYVDTNNNAVCDHSESAPTSLSATAPKENSTVALAEDTTAGQGTGENTVPDIAGDIVSAPIDLGRGKSKPLIPKYIFTELSIALLLLYSVSFILSRKRVISLVLHRRIWNVLLLIAFLVSAILGVLMVLRINFGWPQLPPDTLYWHVEAGIALTVISVFHILWHWKYFKNLLRKNRLECQP
ncbi:MAG: DUF4405 domain-containing protein [Candidatus Micrarchaeota archaeon]